MSLPSYPLPSGPGIDGPQPGLYPLRPLRIGEILAAGLRVAWRHLAVLAPIALIFVLLASAVNLGVLSANGSLHSYAAGDYAVLPANATQAQVSAMFSYLFHKIFVGLAASLVISVMSGPILAGIATPFAALGATTAAGTNSAGLARLRGRWPILIGVGIVVGAAVSVGYVLLIVPGLILWLMLLPAGPVVAMEGSSLSNSLKRATVISKGFKGRLFGVSVLIGLIVGAISLIVGSILGHLVSTTDPVRHLLLTQVISVLVSALLTPWSAAVTGMLYIDIRMRREGLAQALAR